MAETDSFAEEPGGLLAAAGTAALFAELLFELLSMASLPYNIIYLSNLEFLCSVSTFTLLNFDLLDEFFKMDAM